MLTYAQAKIRIVKTDGKLLVAAFNPFINVATDHLAGARNGAEVARVHGTGKISLALCRKVPVGMGKGAAHADHNAS